MRFHPIILYITLTIVICSCKKGSSTTNNCFQSVETVRQLSNTTATIIFNGGEYLIIETGTIDSRLRPCNLPAEYQVNNLSVIVSGDVKLTIQGGPGPCCTENFTITKISK